MSSIWQYHSGFVDLPVWNAQLRCPWQDLGMPDAPDNNENKNPSSSMDITNNTITRIDANITFYISRIKWNCD